MSEMKLEDEYGRNVYLPEHIKEIEIDTSDIDSFMEKIQDFSEQDQLWLIKRLIIETEEHGIRFNIMTYLKAIEKESPNSIKIKEKKKLLDLWGNLPVDIKKEVVKSFGDIYECMETFTPGGTRERKTVMFFMIIHFCAPEEEQALLYLEMNKFKLT